jgi:DNA polymerase (family X)
MTKDEVGRVLQNIARLLELKGENPFKIRAYVNAARALEGLGEDLGKLIAEDRIREIEGIGKAIAEKITTLAQTGKLDYYDNLRETFPPDIFVLFELQGVGAKKIKALYEALGISSITKLERACQDGKIALLPGFGPKSAENILSAIEKYRRSVGQFRLGDVMALAELLLEDLRGHPSVILCEIAGSYRRRKEIIRDLDFIISTRQPTLVFGDFVNHPQVESVIARGNTKASVTLVSGIQCDLRAISTAEYPFALNYFTGSKEHNVRMRMRALERGWSLNEYRFSRAEGRELKQPLPDVHFEGDIYRALGLAYIQPELREDRGELEAAESGRLPDLIEWPNLRGTFHCHTVDSDGQATLEEMAAAGQELGMQYLGIADHSKSSIQANGLDERRLAAQLARIRNYNATHDGIHLFAGVECDIRRDGSLDFPDEILVQLDYVVASVHASLTLGEAAMTHRIIQAMTNRHVTMLGHLTGRMLLTREPYPVNIAAVIEAAAETGTIIELNANPRRLDMDWRWWPLAKQKGVKCAINPDAHSVSSLQNVIFGVGAARKGWLTREDVINTLPLGRIEVVLKAKQKQDQP